ncbi:hypothetical protein BST61_g7822 [Cercospora zeina]
MDMPGGASLSAPNSATQATDLPLLLTTVPREIRDRIYSYCNFSKPPQCRKCSAIEYGEIEYEHPSTTLQPFEHAAKLEKYKTFSWPSISQSCRMYRKYGMVSCGLASRTTFFWINRIPGARAHHKTRYDYICPHRECVSRLKNKKPTEKPYRGRSWPCSNHQEVESKGQRGWICWTCRSDAVPQNNIPALAQVNQQLRAEVLSIIFSTSHLFATVFDTAADCAFIVQKIKAIGTESAAKIKKAEILYSKKKALKYIMTSLMPELKLAGIKTTEGVVELTRWTQKKTVPHRRPRDYFGQGYLPETQVTMPGCQCEFCIVQYLREKDREARGVE